MHQWWILSYGANVGPSHAVDNSIVISLNIKYILIMQKLYNLCFDDNFVILFYNNDFSIYTLLF